MEDQCEDDSCMDDAEWILKIKDKVGKEQSFQLCQDHMKTYAAQAKADGKVVVGLESYEDGDEEDLDEDEDD